MTEQRTRRRYLLALGAASASLAGCSSDEADTPTGGTPTGTATPQGETPPGTQTPPEETPTETESPSDTASPDEPDIGLETVPEWASWVPAELAGDGVVKSIDVARARQVRTDEEYQRMQAVRTAEWLEIDDTAIDRSVTASLGEENSMYVMLGSFDQSAVLETLDDSESEVERRHGFAVLPGLLVGDSAVINHYGDIDPLDTKFGDAASLGSTDGEWQTLLSAVGGGATTLVTPILGDIELTNEPSLFGIGGEPTDDGADALVASHLLFDTEAAATAVIENDRATLTEYYNDLDVLVQGVETEGRRVVVTGKSPIGNFG